ncbi:MAG: alpha-D-ribose 1-methylphosphonate 5-phosphate C-P-lyase PhnJ [Spirochaetales bacterium]|nr:alpha-D-ribose 1-methylphosphonate 5-phosphate C-P-lyase PhnJ [Spirochaetales bacterium]
MSTHNDYNFAFIDENAKKEIRRSILKAICLPGHQVPFASRELPIARGWGTGGLQVTLAIIGPDDVLKVIDQGCDGSVNAVNLRDLIHRTTGVPTTFETAQASIIQTRHRIPELPLREDQIIVFQVPIPEPLHYVEPSIEKATAMHAEKDYARMWVSLYEDIVNYGSVTIGASYPVMVHENYIMAPSPIPKWDIAKLNMANCLHLFGAGREKRIYAVPPYTRVEPLQFEDKPFKKEDFSGHVCARCGAGDSFLDEIFDEASGGKYWVCSDTAYCDSRIQKEAAV